MRSAGTDKSRAPHTGNTGFEDGLEPIPSAALSTIDADQLARLVALGPTRVRVALDCGFDGEYTSQNVIGEITGSERRSEEHTSEIQSLMRISYAVFCLKKKKKTTPVDHKNRTHN